MGHPSAFVSQPGSGLLVVGLQIWPVLRRHAQGTLQFDGGFRGYADAVLAFNYGAEVLFCQVGTPRQLRFAGSMGSPISRLRSTGRMKP